MTSEQQLLTETEASQLLSVSIRTLQSWRLKGGGPSYVKMGRSVRYRRDVLMSFVAAAERRNTSQGEAA